MTKTRHERQQDGLKHLLTDVFLMDPEDKDDEFILWLAQDKITRIDDLLYMREPEIRIASYVDQMA